VDLDGNSDEAEAGTAAHPDFRKPDLVETVLIDVSAEDDDRDVQPDFLKPVVSAGVAGAAIIASAEPDDAADAGGKVDFAILTPAAAAIFLNSFSSRFRSFSLRLSTSSLGTMR
jgi:hypothetical protein